jgi:hypothetical protein
MDRPKVKPFAVDFWNGTQRNRFRSPQGWASSFGRNLDCRYRPALFTVTEALAEDPSHRSSHFPVELKEVVEAAPITASRSSRRHIP